MFAEDNFRSPEDFRKAVYAGNIFRLPATEATKALVAALTVALQWDFGPQATAHTRFDFHSMRDGLAALRGRLTTETTYLDALATIATVAGPAAEFAFDPMRLRCVLPGNHLNKGSEIAYAAHRDTWYGNPQCQVNFWIPLQDVTEEQSFMFYPGLFNKAVPNTSRDFRYGEWSEKHGWQGSKDHVVASFPTVITPSEGGRAFSARAGEIIVFSAAQLHQTVKNVSSLTRFSIDFRAVHLGDHAKGRGAPNADNASTSEALRDYLFPKGRAA
jgi:hypothetical protein